MNNQPKDVEELKETIRKQVFIRPSSLDDAKAIWNTAEEAFDTAITEAHQAGIDEAVEVLKEKRNGHCGKKDCLQAYCINRKIIREFCDDTIKALQNNK